jgi:hypothetical protein
MTLTIPLPLLIIIIIGINVLIEYVFAGILSSIMNKENELESNGEQTDYDRTNSRAMKIAWTMLYVMRWVWVYTIIDELLK